MVHDLEILRFPDARLRNKGVAVEEVTTEHQNLAKKMLDLMYEERGVGLAAIQVNQPVRLFVADTSQPVEEDSRYDEVMGELERTIKQPLVFFNPEITHREGSVIFKEGCLSFPSYYAEVKRAEVVTVKALNLKGEKFELTTDGLLAICIQHEIDHLDGKLFIDHLTPEKAQRLRQQIEKYGYPSKEKIS